jgi:hypothetical protein
MKKKYRPKPEPERYPECRHYEGCLNQYAFTSAKGWDCQGCQQFTPGYRSSYEDLKPYLALLVNVFKPKWRKDYNQQVAKLRARYGQRYEYQQSDDEVYQVHSRSALG